jgi:hypothetical protein
MGMYDSIYTNYRLPNIEISKDFTLVFNAGNVKHFGYETEFQTKDLDCILDRYLISSHGRLLVNERGVNKDTNFHGRISFYTTVKHPLGGGYFIEYHAKFTDGNLVEVGGECNKLIR